MLLYTKVIWLKSFPKFTCCLESITQWRWKIDVLIEYRFRKSWTSVRSLRRWEQNWPKCKTIKMARNVKANMFFPFYIRSVTFDQIIVIPFKEQRVTKLQKIYHCSTRCKMVLWHLLFWVLRVNSSSYWKVFYGWTQWHGSATKKRGEDWGVSRKSVALWPNFEPLLGNQASELMLLYCFCSFLVTEKGLVILASNRNKRS